MRLVSGQFPRVMSQSNIHIQLANTAGAKQPAVLTLEFSSLVFTIYFFL